MIISGPIAESAESKYWSSVHKKQGGHYNTFNAQENGKHTDVSIDVLKTVWPFGKADELNFCLFGTSGVHGRHGSVDALRRSFNRYGLRDWDAINAEAPDDYDDTITFLIVHPRTVTLRFGNVTIKSESDLAYLETLRDSSIDAVMKFLK